MRERLKIICKKQQCFLICSSPLSSCLCPTALTCIFPLKHVAKLKLGYVLSQISLTLICPLKPNILVCCSEHTRQSKLIFYVLRIHISGVTKCVTKFLTLSKSPHCDSVKNFVTHFVTAEIWTLTQKVWNMPQ